ncbi:hypothetical protein PSP6_270199 [Paraburkholderia tropica]|nr:hypothetical protein PSP6_270199 [Paraburkholderia tropica]
MRYEYNGWIIDATPDVCVGKFFAHARLTSISCDAGEEPEMHIERDIAWFDTEEQAVRCARQWAIAWIDARQSHGECLQTTMPVTRHTRSVRHRG